MGVDLRPRLPGQAHAGGVDPEATAPATEMRAALIRETARLLRLTNISFAADHILIDGTRRRTCGTARGSTGQSGILWCSCNGSQHFAGVAKILGG
jgi:hypothetical protein